MSIQMVGTVHLIAGTAEMIPQVLSLLKRDGVEVEGNPDIYVREHQYFNVEDARSLRERASLRPMGDRRVFVIAASDINHNAQNALLKTLEEPPADAAFFFIIPAPETLLPTFRSRAQMLVLDGAGGEMHAVDAKAFLAALPEKRLDMLKPLLEKDEDDKRDIGSILTFLSSLERSVARAAPSTAKRNALEAVYRARKYMGDKGALVKALLEQVALLIPKV